MSDDTENMPFTTVEDLKTLWTNLQAMLEKAEYIYRLYRIEYYEGDDYPPEMVQPAEEQKVLREWGIAANITFNGFTDASEYHKFLRPFVNQYEEAILEFIDNTNFSVGERLKYSFDQLEAISKIKKQLFTKNDDGGTSSRSNLQVLNSTHEESDYWKVTNDHQNYSNEISSALSPFVSVQYESLHHLERLIQHVCAFVPGRLEEHGAEPEEGKLPFQCPRADLLILMLSLRKLGLIAVRSDHELAKFMEMHFLYKKEVSTEIAECCN